jgi:hypothetical protein
MSPTLFSGAPIFPAFQGCRRLRSNEALQPTSASGCGGVAVEWLDGAQTRMLVSRLDSRSLAAELRR